MNTKIRVANINDLKRTQELDLKLFENKHNKYDPTENLDWTYSDIGTNYFKDRITNNNGYALVAVLNDKTVGVDD